LRKSTKKWHEKFDYVILSNGFKYEGANNVFIQNAQKISVFVCFYVDDILIFKINMKCMCMSIFQTKKYLTSRFKIKDL